MLAEEVRAVLVLVPPGSAGTILWSRSAACPLALTAVRGAAMSSWQSWAASVARASPLLAEKLDVHS